MATLTAKSTIDSAAAQFVLRPLSTTFDTAAWDDLAAHAAEPNPFAERWFLEAARALPDAAGVMIAEAWRGGSLLAAMPLTIDPHYGRLPLPHVESWQHYHSFLGAPLLRSGDEEDGWHALLTGLDRAPFARGLLHFPQIVEHGPTHRALIAAARRSRRPCVTVHRIERAALASALSPEDYVAANVRGKKRKEWRRLEMRLRDQGALAVRRFDTAHDDIAQWTQDFLSLEARGWKGQSGSALGQAPGTRRFFTETLAAAAAADRIDIVRLELDGHSLAILVTLLSGHGGFAFKTAFDEDYARFSPGVMLQLASLDLPMRRGLTFVDSCASPNHSMIDHIWAERRAIIRVTLPLAGARGAATFALARVAETASARLKELRR